MSIIKQIEQYIEGIEVNYKKFDENTFSGTAEYTPTVHKKVLKEVIELLKAVVVAPDLFIREFTLDEMNRIVGLAGGLSGNPDHNVIFQHLNLDAHRSLISRMRNIFGKKEALQYKSEMDKLQESMVRVEEMLEKEERVSAMQENIKNISAQLGGITESQNQAQAGLEDVQKKNAEVVNVLNSVNATSGDIEKKHPALVKFFGEILQNQKDLQELKKQNVGFSEKLENDDVEYEKKREENLKELQEKSVAFSEKQENDYAEYLKKRGEMVKAAESMLGLANAAELANAFNQRIDKAKEKLRWPWVGGAIFFIIVTMGTAIGLYSNQGDNITLTGTLARMSITAVPFLAAWFCGAQYLNLERTLEDYQYKKALAQSMPAFMEQLGKDNVEYRAYLFLVFQQMLQDPLRKKHDVPSPLKDLFDKMLEKFSKSIIPEKKDENL